MDPLRSGWLESDMDPAAIAVIQALYYVTTGVWPLIHVRSFQWATGPKTDLWLVQTVGVLVTAIGISLLWAGWTGATGTEVLMLAVGSAAGLAAIDVVFVARGVISRIYLVDAIAEAVLIACWIAARIAGG
jgi:hypothetical protein